MKKVITFIMIMLIVLSAFSIVGNAEESADTGALDEAFDTLKDVFSSLDVDWESLRAYAMENKSDIATIALLVVAAIMRSIAKTTAKKVLPEAAAQIKATKELADGIATQDSEREKKNEAWKAAADLVLDKMQDKLNESEERDKLLTRATEALEASDKRYSEMTKLLAEAFMLQATTNYDTLMSAKLTDIRKAEIEKNYLNQKEFYSRIYELCSANVGEVAVSEELTEEKVTANEEALVA